MVRDTRWRSFFYSAMIAGFEAYGSAQIGMAPSCMSTDGPGAQPEDQSVLKTAGFLRCNQPVAKPSTDPVFNVCASKASANVMWRHA